MEIKDLIDPITTLAATFLGAFLAFLVERRKANAHEQKAQAGAANMAIFTLFDYWSTLEQYRKNFIEPYRGKPDAWLNMSASPETFSALTSLSPGDLAFLLQSGHAEAYSHIMIEEQRFKYVTALIDERNSIILREVFPKLSAIGMKVGASSTEADMELAIGIDVVHKLKIITKGIVDCVDENLISIREAHDELRAVISELYPKVKPIRAEFSLPLKGNA